MQLVAPAQHRPFSMARQRQDNHARAVALLLQPLPQQLHAARVSSFASCATGLRRQARNGRAIQYFCSVEPICAAQQQDSMGAGCAPIMIPSQMQDAEARVVHQPAHARSALLPSKTVGSVPRLQQTSSQLVPFHISQARESCEGALEAPGKDQCQPAPLQQGSDGLSRRARRPQLQPAARVQQPGRQGWMVA